MKDLKDMFSPVMQNAALPTPVVKANKLLVAELERIVSFQMGVMKYYTEMVLNQLKAAAQVENVDALQEFVKAQADVATKIRDRMMTDAKALTELGMGFKADFDALAKDSAEDFTAKKAA